MLISDDFVHLIMAVGSFYAVQFGGNLIVAAVNCFYSCKDERVYTVLLFLYLGVSVIGTNILCHRLYTNFRFSMYPLALSLYNHLSVFIKISS